MRPAFATARVIGASLVKGYGRRAKTSGGTFRIDSYAASIGSPLGPFWAEGKGPNLMGLGHARGPYSLSVSRIYYLSADLRAHTLYPGNARAP
jgi:hypothetical protein